MSLVEVKNLNKKFGKKQVLHDVNFVINEGEILGFIGPNGAGKTTTIKLMLGLQSIGSGTVTIDGYDIVKDFEKAIKGVGAIVESPDLYMYLSGRQNLQLIANYYKGITKERIDEVIKIIGLGKRIDDKVSKYSLGMRQRLGIGAAILHNPRVLILDEPTNGLDPEGIKDVRELLIKLAKKEKMAILISSHNLSELDNFVTTACIIQNGHVVSNTSVKNLKKYDSSRYKIFLDKTKGISKYIKQEHNIISDYLIEVFIEDDDVSDLLLELLNNKYKIRQVIKEEMSLEDAFIKMTGGNTID